MCDEVAAAATWMPHPGVTRPAIDREARMQPRPTLADPETQARARRHMASASPGPATTHHRRPADSRRRIRSMHANPTATATACFPQGQARKQRLFPRLAVGLDGPMNDGAGTVGYPGRWVTGRAWTRGGGRGVGGSSDVGCFGWGAAGLTTISHVTGDEGKLFAIIIGAITSRALCSLTIIIQQRQS